MATANETLRSMRAFVIGPIGDEDAPRESERYLDYERALQVLHEVIKPACVAHGITVIRADEITKVGEINEQVYRLLRDSPLVIADLTGANPNVMYELGLRHSTGKLTIPIGEKGLLPFDVSAIRTILFERSEHGLYKARTRLITAIGTALEEGTDPVTATRLWFEDRIGSAASVDAKAADEEVADLPTEDEPGFLEKIAELEDAVPGLAQSLSLSSSILNGITETFTEGARETSNVSSAKQKLLIADKVSEKLEALATRLAIASSDVTSDVDRFETGYGALRKQWSPDGAEEQAEFQQAIVMLSEAAISSIPGASTFRSTLRSTEHATKRMKLVYEHIAQSLDAIIAAATRVGRWKDLVNDDSAGGSSQPSLSGPAV